jgi:internalin A
MTDLRFLDLGDTPVADVTPLQGLTQMQEIDLRGTQVTNIAPLASLTGCMIITRSNPRIRRRR